MPPTRVAPLPRPFGGHCPQGPERSAADRTMDSVCWPTPSGRHTGDSRHASPPPAPPTVSLHQGQGWRQQSTYCCNVPESHKRPPMTRRRRQQCAAPGIIGRSCHSGRHTALCGARYLSQTKRAQGGATTRPLGPDQQRPRVGGRPPNASAHIGQMVPSHWAPPALREPPQSGRQPHSWARHLLGPPSRCRRSTQSSRQRLWRAQPPQHM